MPHRVDRLSRMKLRWPTTRKGKWFAWLAVAATVYTVAGFVLLPVILKWQLPKQLLKYTQRPATVEAVRLNPYVFSLTVRGLALRERDGAEFASVGALYVNFQPLDSLFHRTWTVKQLRVSQPSARVVWNKDGTFNFSDLLASGSSAASSEPSKPLPPASIEELIVTNGVVHFKDQRLDRPAELLFDQLLVTLRNFTTLPQAAIALSASARWNNSGTASVAGHVGLFPVFADLQVDAEGVDLRPIQPYVHEYADMTVNSGAVSARGRLTYAMPQSPVALARFSGDVTVSRFATVDNVLSRDLVKWDTLALTGLRADVEPYRAHANEIKFTKLESHLVIGPDTKPVMLAVLKRPATTSDSSPDAAGPAIEISVDTFVLDDATVIARDLSTQPNVYATVRELTGTIKGLSSRAQSKADVDIHGMIGGVAPFQMTGQINPLSPEFDTDLVIASKNIDLTPPSPYMGKYAGYPITKGNLTLDLSYHIAKRELKAENKIVIEHLTLGPKTDSPDATKLPVRLALALLTDRNGRIDLDVPVQGRIDDPEFRIGRVVLRVLVNLLTKAATSPFKLLSMLVPGGNAEELAFVDFDPGSVALSAEQTAKLDKLAHVLSERPALHVEIAGSVDPAADREAIGRARLVQDIRSRRFKELPPSKALGLSAETLEVAPDDYNRLLSAIYKEFFGTAPVFVSVPATNAPAAGPKINFTWGKGKAARPAPFPATAAGAITIEEVERRVIEKIEVTEDDLRQLMTARAGVVLNYLLTREAITPERLSVATPDPPSPGSGTKSQATLGLN
jgi:hypothetical protein